MIFPVMYPILLPLKSDPLNKPFIQRCIVPYLRTDVINKRDVAPIPIPYGRAVQPCLRVSGSHCSFVVRPGPQRGNRFNGYSAVVGGNDWLFQRINGEGTYSTGSPTI